MLTMRTTTPLSSYLRHLTEQSHVDIDKVIVIQDNPATRTRTSSSTKSRSILLHPQQHGPEEANSPPPEYKHRRSSSLPSCLDICMTNQLGDFCSSRRSSSRWDSNPSSQNKPDDFPRSNFEHHHRHETSLAARMMRHRRWDSNPPCLTKHTGIKSHDLLRSHSEHGTAMSARPPKLPPRRPFSTWEILGHDNDNEILMIPAAAKERPAMATTIITPRLSRRRRQSRAHRSKPRTYPTRTNRSSVSGNDSTTTTTNNNNNNNESPRMPMRFPLESDEVDGGERQ